MEYVNNASELNYMTQIVIMVYEDPNKVYFDFNLRNIIRIFLVNCIFIL